MKPPPIPPRIRNYENIEVIRPQPSAPSAPDASSCGSGAHVFDRISINSNHSGPPGIYPSDFIIAMELQNEEAAEAFSDVFQQAQSINYARELQMQELNNLQRPQVVTTTIITTSASFRPLKKRTICVSLLVFSGLIIILCLIISYIKYN